MKEEDRGKIRRKDNSIYLSSFHFSSVVTFGVIFNVALYWRSVRPANGGVQASWVGIGLHQVRRI